MVTKTPATPAEVDAQLARIYERQDFHVMEVMRLKELVRKNAGVKDVTPLNDKIRPHRTALADLREEARPLEDEYVARGWPRYWKVTNGNGHVHANTACSTCFPTTQFAWMTAFSGLTVEELVAEVGEMACTVCFPSAPTLKGYGEVTRRTQAEKDAKNAEREAAKCPGAGLPPGYVVNGKQMHVRRMYEKFGTVTGDPDGKGIKDPDVDQVCSECGKRTYKDRDGNVEYHKRPKREPKWKRDQEKAKKLKAATS